MKQQMQRQRYSVGGYGGSRHGYAPTLGAAKKVGALIAKKEAWKGKWNVSYIPISIYESDGPAFYRYTGWTMFVPVRGSGMRWDQIEQSIRQREGAAPFVWVHKQTRSNPASHPRSGYVECLDPIHIGDLVKEGRRIIRVEAIIGRDTVVLQEMGRDRAGRLRSLGEDGRYSSIADHVRTLPIYRERKGNPKSS